MGPQGRGGGGTLPLPSEPGSSFTCSEEAATLSSTLWPPSPQRQLPGGEPTEGELGPWGAVGIAGPASTGSTGQRADRSRVLFCGSRGLSEEAPHASGGGVVWV
ncbi:unnamed protein product [Rangifer tarandus platyrhynchus]|uniref:Uncharacterized protein n=2 Tax=Rangifer tarandus platyrhynchus TaxID=3082113 RepID=A0ABN8Z380_RANTA|nr:unnamed protein product [Rangifer tarandus platyrhynchus]